jgi:D-amino-acid dehydrogenase
MTSVAVIGGGVVGSAAGTWLAADGLDVTVFERDLEARPASTGNAGVCMLSAITPMARPSILGSVPGWMLDPLGPLTLRLIDVPGLAPFLARFVAAARPSQVASSTTALGFLMKTALADHQELGRRSGIGDHFKRTGALHLFDTDHSYRTGQAEWRERGSHGVDYREVTVAEARAMAPGLSGPFAHAILAPDIWMVDSPNGLLQALRGRLQADNRLRTAEIVDLRPGADGVGVATKDGGETRFDAVVVAGGVWSRDLVRKLGLGVVLEAERGYNTTWTTPPIRLTMPVFFDDHGFCASPLDDGLRVGGAVELAAVDAPPNFARAAAMRKKMRRYFPTLPEEGGREWMGCRPSTPDSLPVIGAHPREPRVVFAFGHGHLGMTLSAVTARHVADLVGRRGDRNLAPFGIERFQ